MRCIAAILCVLYLSISTVMAASHHHSPGTLDHGAKCAACAWHAETIADVPEVIVSINAPAETVLGQRSEQIILLSSDIVAVLNRGPPSFSSLKLVG
jgi:hypothetical protein